MPKYVWTYLFTGWGKVRTFLSSKRNDSLSEQAIILFAGNVLALSFAIAVPIVLVRIFPQKTYGLYQQLLLIFTTLQPLGQWGVTQGLYYFLPREPENRIFFVAQTYLFVFLVGLICCSVLIIFRNLIGLFMNNPTVELYIPILSIYIMLMIISSFLETILIIEGRSHNASILRAGSEFVRSISIAITALLTRSIFLIFSALVIFSLSRCILQWYYLRKKYQLSIKNIKLSNLKRQINYSIPIGLANISFIIQQKIHNFVVTSLFSPITYATYTVGSYSLPFLSIITSSVSNIMVPELSRCQKDGNHCKILNIWHSALRKSNLVLFPSFVFFFVMADAFIVLFFTEQYLASIPIFRISLFGILLSGANAGAILNAYAATRYQMKLALFRLPVTLLLVYACAMTYGIHGAITANVVAFSFFRFLMIAKASKVMHLPLADLLGLGVNGKIMVAALAGGLAAAAVQQLLQVTPLWAIVISLPIYLVIYCLVALGLGVLSSGEIAMCCRAIFPNRASMRKIK